MIRLLLVMFGKKKDNLDEEYAKKIGKVIILMKEKKYEEALKIHESVFDKKRASDWYTRGNLLSHLKKFHDAIECYDKAIRLDPNYVKAWYRKGHLLNRFLQHLESAKCFEKILEFDSEQILPNNAEEWAKASGFSCLMSYIYEYNHHVLNKKQMSEEIFQKTNYWINMIRPLLEKEKIVPQFDDETKFVDYCYLNFNTILNRLEPEAEGLFLRGTVSQWNIQYGDKEELKKKGFKTD